MESALIEKNQQVIVNATKTFSALSANSKNVIMIAIKANAIIKLENVSARRTGPVTTAQHKHVLMIVIITVSARVENASAMTVSKANSARLQFVKIIAITKDYALKVVVTA